ncbi:retrovirus-related pol polyprotein from transposon TNT 1-94 [Tanacetum coccineum]
MHKRASFKSKQNFSIRKCLHLLHMDLFGPVSSMSINHEKYTLVVIDEYSRYTWVHFLKKKSHAAEMIMSFISMVKNQNDVKVKQIRIDNGTEFRSSKLESFCDEKGISQNCSSPNTLEQNGVAERKNRTLIEAARTMLNGIDDQEINTLNLSTSFVILVKAYLQEVWLPSSQLPQQVDAMQEELNQFYRNKVWTLVPLPYGKIAIGSKWVFRNKKDEHGIVTKNKARLVTQGYNQEEGIAYDETFAPVARMEAIRIFLAFATYMNFIVFLIDVKSAFLNGKLKEEVYVEQPHGFKSSEFPDYVCKLDKTLYRLKQAPRA